MLKIEESYTEISNPRNGWYLDREETPFFFVNDKPIGGLGSKGNLFAAEDFAIKHYVEEDYAPFTRLTGRIIISND